MPIRTCIGCRRKEEQGSLIRVGRDAEGNLRIGVGPGRSAYVHRDAECLEAAFQKGRIERALRGRVEKAEREDLRKEIVCQLR